uniref:Uncharacterized protein n=1 Tax=Meloidogyne enterolobii TaxID=390850 RepID=A0A6V7X3R8_MELEN|nr:unnamed protein product [Meloidogyne enterolobii]
MYMDFTIFLNIFKDILLPFVGDEIMTKGNNKSRTIENVLPAENQKHQSGTIIQNLNNMYVMPVT